MIAPWIHVLMGVRAWIKSIRFNAFVKKDGKGKFVR